MWRIVCALLVLILLCSGCAAPGAQTQQITPSPLTPKPAKTALPTQTPYIDGTIPETERNYFPVSYSDYRKLSGGLYTEKDLELFANILNTFEWKSLAVVLSMFGTQIVDTRVGDLRMCDFEDLDQHYYGHYYQPEYEKDLGIAYISMSTFDWNDETEYLLLFVKQSGKETYAPQSIVTLHNDHYDGQPTLEFQKIGAKTYLIWSGLTGHGTGYNETSEKWYDVETGVEMYSFSTRGGDANWVGDGIDAEEWRTSVAYQPIPLNKEGDYYLNARVTQSFTFKDGSLKAYQCDYRICYDADKNAFYTAFDALLPLYQRLQKSEYETIRKWADAGIKRIGELRNPIKEEMPKEDQRFLLSETASHIRESRFTAEKLTEKQMLSIVTAINRTAPNLGKALDYWRMGKGEVHDILFEMYMENKSDVTCRLDMETCRERIVFFHIAYSEGREKRGITLVYLLTAEGDEWAFHTAITYPLYGDAELSVKYYNPYSCAISVPVTRKNGRPLYETIVIDSGRLSRGLLFVGEYVDREGNKYKLTFYPEKVRGDKLGELYAGAYSDEGSYYIDKVSLNVWDDYPWQGGEAFISKEDYEKIALFLP